MKCKNKEVGICNMCGKETTKRIPVKPFTFYCGCEGARCL